MTRRPACLPVAAVGLLAVLAGAAPAAAQGTEEERRACTPDAMRLCREYIPNVDRIIACMVARRAELSPECQAFVKPPEPEPTAVAAAKPSRTAVRSAAPKATAVRTAAKGTAKETAKRPAKAVTTTPRPAHASRKPAAPMNLLPAAARPTPAKKVAPRSKQAQRTQ